MFRAMKNGERLDEEQIATLAKKFRQAAGKSQLDAAHELRVSKPAISQAENQPEKSFFKLRKRMIEKYSPFKVIGPGYWLERK